MEVSDPQVESRPVPSEQRVLWRIHRKQRSDSSDLNFRLVMVASLVVVIEQEGQRRYARRCVIEEIHDGHVLAEFSVRVDLFKTCRSQTMKFLPALLPLFLS
ncbi:hypothetical protein NPIL_381791 [Nephila pilipes]|uniref:Uncharacterized protein n=1 Tax=Nephila pilipes TaxID=299642 RepID=A0A8X6T7F5_NEPPI|nr:hypothetical protein NPIL_381791 [Nephila pilipes]